MLITYCSEGSATPVFAAWEAENIDRCYISVLCIKVKNFQHVIKYLSLINAKAFLFFYKKDFYTAKSIYRGMIVLCIIHCFSQQRMYWNCKNIITDDRHTINR